MDGGVCRDGQQVVVDVGQAEGLFGIDAVIAIPVLGAGPLAFPAVRVGHGECVLQRVATVEQLDALDDVGRDAVVPAVAVRAQRCAVAAPGGGRPRPVTR